MKEDFAQEQLAVMGGEKTRKVPYQVLPEIGDEEKLLVEEVLRSGLLSGFVASPGEHFLGGPKVKELERLFREYCGCKFAVAMNSATAGLHAALSALGIKAGDEVIVPPYTMSATAAAVLMQNAVPVFADIEEATFCMDPSEIEKKITSRTKAIMVVHLFGLPADMEPIMAIATKHGLPVVEDCAQAPGALYKGRQVGTIGRIGVFSFNQHKIISTGEGGVAVTEDPRLALRLQLVRNHGEVVTGKMNPEDVQEDIIGWNYRMTELEAAVGIAQFKRLDRLTEERIRLADHLTSRLSGIPGLTVPPRPSHSKHVYFTYPLKWDEQATGVERSLFLKALAAEGIPCAGGYVRPIYHEPIFRKACPAAFCPVTEKMHFRELFVLPICRRPHTISDMEDAVRAIQKIVGRLSALKGTV